MAAAERGRSAPEVGGDNPPPSALPRGSPAARPRHIAVPRAPRPGGGASGRVRWAVKGSAAAGGPCSLPGRALRERKMPAPPWVSDLHSGLN